MPLDDMIGFGPFAIDARGEIALRASEASFGFTWRGRRIACRLAPDGIMLSMCLGRVPSTVAAAEAREGVFGTVEALPALLRPGWRLALLPDHSVHLSAALSRPLPIGAVDLMTAAVGFLLSAAPYLPLLDEAGLVPALPVPAHAATALEH